jgi:hypothetical protein
VDDPDARGRHLHPDLEILHLDLGPAAVAHTGYPDSRDNMIAAAVEFRGLDLKVVPHLVHCFDHASEAVVATMDVWAEGIPRQIEDDVGMGELRGTEKSR